MIMKKQYKINDLPKTCYAIQPIYEGQLKRGFNTPVIIIHKDETGYYKTLWYDLLKEFRKLKGVQV